MMFFFFKQKTAYEMRISDWSSDVCSSDLEQRTHHDIERLRRSLRQQNMVRINVLSIFAQPLRDMLAQWHIAERVAITRNLHRGHARQLMQRLAHPCFVEPFGRHPPATGLDRNRMIGENIAIGRASCRERVCQYV